MSRVTCVAPCRSSWPRTCVLWTVYFFAWMGHDETSGQDRRGPFVHPTRSVRSRDVDQKHIRLELAFDFEKREVAGRAKLTVVPFKPVSSMALDAAEMNVQQVQVEVAGSQPGARDLAFQQSAHSLEISLDRIYQPDETITLYVRYQISRPQHGAHFVVPDESEPDQPRMVWTQSEPEFARFWFPCIDSPADRLTSEIVVTVPNAYFVLSNGELTEKSANPDATATWHWSQKLSHVPYLMSVVAGEFDEFKQEWNKIPILSYVPKGRLPQAARSFEKTPAMVEYFSRRFGVKYPWPKYAQICVDEYMWGGMEHTSATTLTDRTLHDERAHLDETSDGLVAHELAHQWFGDLVTCKDWGEIWLNESFATYCETVWQEYDEGPDEAVWAGQRDAEQYLDEDKRYRRSIVNYRYNSPEDVFDSHSYPKGGRVLHMLRFVLGEEQFWRAIQHYVTTNQHRTVETADFRRAIEESTGQGLNWFFDQWLYRGGHPEFEVTWSWDAESRVARLMVKQTQTVNDLTPLFRTPVEIELATRNGTQLRRIEVSKAEETFHFQCEERPTRVCFDPRNWLLKTLSFSKSKQELLDQLAHDTHVLPRVQAVQGLQEFINDQDVQRALMWAVRKDTFWAVRQEAAKVLGRHSTDEIRKVLLEAAKQDPKSFVRREALAAAGNFKHAETAAALRGTISSDPSYYAVAEALKALVKVDRDNCGPELLAASELSSHEEVILRAACEGLVETKHPEAVTRLSGLLEKSPSPERKVILLGAVARMNPGGKEVVDRLVRELDNNRPLVRRLAIHALVAIGNPEFVSELLERRAKEESPRMIQAFDAGIASLQGKDRSVDQLHKEIDQLRGQNKRLEERLKAIEQKQ